MRKNVETQKEVRMKLREDQVRVQELLRETITLLCKNGLSYNTKFTVEALIGVTVDDNEVFLVNVKESIRNENAETEDSDTDEKAEASRAKARVKRKRPPDHGDHSSVSTKKKSRSDDEDNSDDSNDDALNISSNNPTADYDSRLNVKQEPDDEGDLLFVKQEQTDLDNTALNAQPSYSFSAIQSQHGQSFGNSQTLDTSHDTSWAQNQPGNMDPSNLASMAMAQATSQGASNQLVCPYCCQIYKIKQAFKYHLSLVHNIGERVKCDRCGRDDFKAYATFTQHKRKCTGPKP